MNKFVKTTGILALTLASSAAFSVETGFYAGLGYGQADNKGCDDVPFDADIIECKDTKSVWKGVFGYNFHQNFGVEFGYNNIGQAFLSEEGSVIPGSDPVRRYVDSVSIEGVAYSLALVGHLDFVNNFSGFAKVGMANWHADVELTLDGTLYEGDDDGTELMFGLGVAYTDDGHQMRLEWDRFEDVLTDDGYVNTISLVYTFSF